jgi:uncharacterized membrane protein YecN with MAPEG domain
MKLQISEFSIEWFHVSGTVSGGMTELIRQFRLLLASTLLMVELVPLHRHPCVRFHRRIIGFRITSYALVFMQLLLVWYALAKGMI